MGKDWQAVAEAVTNRLSELDMTQQELSERSGLSVTTIRQIQNNYEPRNRSRRTLGDLSAGLRWPRGYLAQLLDGGEQPDDDSSVRADLDQLRAEVVQLRDEVAGLRGLVEGLDR